MNMSMTLLLLGAAAVLSWMSVAYSRISTSGGDAWEMGMKSLTFGAAAVTVASFGMRWNRRWWVRAILAVLALGPVLAAFNWWQRLVGTV